MAIALLHAEESGWSADRNAAFVRDGFFLFDRFLGRGAVRSLRIHVDAALRRGDVADEEWVLGLHETLPASSNWMWSLAREVSPVAAAILGAPVALYCSQISSKSPAASSGALRSQRVPTHQDGDAGKVITFWIALDRIDAVNGGMRFECGGHTRGRRALVPVRSAAELAAAQRNARYNVFHAAGDPMFEVRLAAGGASVHHPHLPHASAPNAHRFRQRRAIILRFSLASDARAGGGAAASSDGIPANRSREHRALPISLTSPFPVTRHG